MLEILEIILEVFRKYKEFLGFLFFEISAIFKY